jgi:carboxymethylenebutenolidase
MGEASPELPYADSRFSAGQTMTDANDFVRLVQPSGLTRRTMLRTALAGGFALAVQPVTAATIHTRAEGLIEGVVQIPLRDGTAMPAYRAAPEPSGTDQKPPPAVLVIEEIFGIHEHIRDICRRLAHAGYCAVAPELFARYGDVTQLTDINEILNRVIAKVGDTLVMSDLDDTLDWLAKNGLGDTRRAAITGFCWGGRIVWLYSAHNPQLRAGVAWYGRLVGEKTALQPMNPVDVAGQLKVPVLGLYGGSDEGIPPESIGRMRAALAAGHARADIVVYPETPHGFNADYRPSYREVAARDGWTRMLGWFANNGVKP